MSSKKWLIAFFATILLIGAGVVGFNYLMDPFGVFRNPLLEWPSYEMTVNPRTAKFTYLQQHAQEYDSYIIGGSSTSSYPTAQLNRYFNASFYNLIMYGSDMLDVEQFSTWLLENCEVKNLVVNVYIESALSYDTVSHPLSFAMPAELTGENPLAFYAKFLLMDPRHSVDKLRAMGEDTYLTQSFDVFNEQTGAYDKKVRDAEGIGPMEDYLEAYPVFADYPKYSQPMSEAAIAGTLNSLTAIRNLCAERGVNLVVVCAPVYHEYLDCFDRAQVEDFYTRLAQVTPYWDFTYSSVSFEPRYFYDEGHFRNCVGEMALARMFGDESVYVPEDFGAYVTAETVQAHLVDMSEVAPLPAEDYTAQVPVLMYHSVAPEGNDSTIITPELFREHIAALAQAGYTAVTPDQLADYVHTGAALPAKPVVITFDDGYLDNYTQAYPVLKEYNMPATIFAVGATVGNTEHYKDTDYPITPHFSYEQGAEMVSSGLISIQSHTYDMHQWAPYETGRAREDILRWAGESEAEYRQTLSADCQTIRAAIQEGTGEPSVHVMAYPSGRWDNLAQVTLLENGFDTTFTTRPGDNVLVKGLAQSLLGLKRYTMSQAVSIEQLLEWVSGARG